MRDPSSRYVEISQCDRFSANERKGQLRSVSNPHFTMDHERTASTSFPFSLFVRFCSSHLFLLSLEETDRRTEELERWTQQKGHLQRCQELSFFFALILFNFCPLHFRYLFFYSEPLYGFYILLLYPCLTLYFDFFIFYSFFIHFFSHINIVHMSILNYSPLCTVHKRKMKNISIVCFCFWMRINHEQRHTLEPLKSQYYMPFIIHQQRK